MNRAVFLDRDGVINENPGLHDYVRSPAALVLLPQAREGVRLLNDAGWLVIVISNQRGVARGLLTVDTLRDINQKLAEELSAVGARVDAIYCCPHDHEEKCGCRKPEPGLLLQAARDWGVDIAQSYVIGDSRDDIEAGARAGCRGEILVLTGRGGEELSRINEWVYQPEAVLSDLYEAAQFITSRGDKQRDGRC